MAKHRIEDCNLQVVTGNFDAFSQTMSKADHNSANVSKVVSSELEVLEAQVALTVGICCNEINNCYDLLSRIARSSHGEDSALEAMVCDYRYAIYYLIHKSAEYGSYMISAEGHKQRYIDSGNFSDEVAMYLNHFDDALKNLKYCIERRNDKQAMYKKMLDSLTEHNS